MPDPATPKLGHAAIPMRRVHSRAEVCHPGDFYWRGTPGTADHEIVIAYPTRHYMCRPASRDPSRCHEHARLRYSGPPTGWTLGRPNDNDAQWRWDGNLDEPTLRPSLHAVGEWHGWVTGGVMSEA